jgi:tetratricopeptide (TPR) repeat protein
MEYSMKALTLARELKVPIEEMRILFNLGIVLKLLKKNSEASQAFLETIALAQGQGNSLLVSKAKAELVLLAVKTEKDTTGEETLQSNIDILTQKGDRLNTAEAHFKLAEWYATRKEYAKAFDYLKRG